MVHVMRRALILLVLFFAEGLAQADQIDDLARQLRTASDYKVRLSAALNLGKVGAKDDASRRRAVPVLIDALRDRDKTVRGVAASSLGRLVNGSIDASTRSRAAAELDRIRKGDSDGFVRAQAEKAYATVSTAGGASVAGGRRVYIEVGPMTDGTRKAGTKVVGVMRNTVESTINRKAPAYATRWPSGRSPSKTDLSTAGTKAAFYVDGTLTTLDTRMTGSMAEVSCNVSLIIASFPEKSMFGFLKGGAAVQTGASDRAIDEAKADCVGAVLEDLVARQVVPTIQGRVP
jgi:hypothetical protein